MARRPDPRLVRRVLDAAQALARESGWPASAEAIARRARVSRSTLFLRFEDKPALDVAVLEEAILRLTSRLAEAGPQHDLQAEVGWVTRLVLRTPAPSALVLTRLHGLLRSAFGEIASDTLCADLLPLGNGESGWIEPAGAAA